jgi:hypothetical protein
VAGMTAAICAGFFTMAALILIIVLAYDVSLAYGIALFGLVWFGFGLVWFGFGLVWLLSFVAYCCCYFKKGAAGGRRAAAGGEVKSW